MENPHAADTKDPESMDEKELKKLAKELEKKMRQAAAELNFEEAANLRDRMIEVKKCCLIYYESVVKRLWGLRACTQGTIDI